MLEKIIVAFMFSAGLFFLTTGVGGGRYSFTTGEWSFNERTTPAQTRIVGAVFIAFAIGLSRLRRK